MESSIYISGAMSNDPNYKEKFNKAEDLLRTLGWKEVHNPIYISDFVINMNKIKDPFAEENRHYFLKADAEDLLKCDCIYMLKGWEKSRGATFEHNIAEQCGLQILFEK